MQVGASKTWSRYTLINSAWEEVLLVVTIAGVASRSAWVAPVGSLRVPRCEGCHFNMGMGWGLPPVEAGEGGRWNGQPPGYAGKRGPGSPLTHCSLTWTCHFDNRRIEVVANGLPLHHGAQLAVDTKVVSPSPVLGNSNSGVETSRLQPWQTHAGPKSVHTPNYSGVGVANLSWWH